MPKNICEGCHFENDPKAKCKTRFNLEFPNTGMVAKEAKDGQFSLQQWNINFNRCTYRLTDEEYEVRLKASSQKKPTPAWK